MEGYSSSNPAPKLKWKLNNIEIPLQSYSYFEKSQVYGIASESNLTIDTKSLKNDFNHQISIECIAGHLKLPISC